MIIVAMKKAENIVTDFSSKILNQKDRDLPLTITIQNIEPYSVNSIILKRDMKKVVFGIVLKLSAIYNYYAVNSK